METLTTSASSFSIYLKTIRAKYLKSSAQRLLFALFSLTASVSQSLSYGDIKQKPQSHSSCANAVIESLEENLNEFSLNSGERAARNQWASSSNRLAHLKHLEKVFNIKSPEDWYAITTTDIKAQPMGSNFLKVYPSFLDILKELYPSYEWLPWRLKAVPYGYWKIWENRRKYLDWLGKKLGFHSPDDWYKITQKDFHQNYGAGLLARTYDDSAYAALQDLLPEYKFLPWKFGKAPSGFWSKPENVKSYMEWLSRELHYQSPEDWYKVTNEDFKKHFGGGLLDKLTPRQALAIAYPGEDWVPWKFKQLGADFWNSRENRHDYILWLGKKLGFRSVDDWYSISMSDIHNNYGAGFIDHYGNYTYKALQDLFPEQKWEPWKFKTLNKKWTDIKDRRLFADHVMRELGMQNLDEWYGITYSAIDKVDGSNLRWHYGGSVYKFVKDVYPEHNWNEIAFQSISRSQARLTEIVQKLFPNHRILVNYKHPEMRFKESNRKMELDIYLPDSEIAFEYQGEQHYYSTTWASPAAVARNQVRDREKRARAKELGIKLIEIDYHWDRKENSVIEEINKMFPGLLTAPDRAAEASKVPH